MSGRRNAGRIGEFDGGRAGYVFVEVLAALAVTGILATVLLQGLGTIRIAGARSDRMLSASLVADRVIEQIATPAALAAGTVRGSTDGIGWSASVRPEAALDDLGRASRWRPVRIALRIEAGGGELSIETIRIVRRP